MAAHAVLSASSAKRWMACPPSARLEEALPDKGSEYAAEGTYAHSMAELILRYNNKEISKKAFTTRINKLKEDPHYSKDLEDYVSDYCSTVWELVNTARRGCPDALVLFEQRLDFSDYVPDGFGTGDVVIVADDTLYIADLKYGKGVGVQAEDNPQLMLYGLGAYLEHSLLYDIQKISMHIIQPRLDSHTEHTVAADDLLAWAEGTVKPVAAQAYAGEGTLSPGDHCRFCKVKAQCRARADENLALVQLDFEDPVLLADEEIGRVLAQADKLAAWAKDVMEYVYQRALEGQKFEGWKLVEGRSNRKYTDELQVASALTGAGYAEALIYEKKLLGITAMEKVVGKKVFGDLLNGLVEKPEGKPVLVVENDKRPEIRTAEKAAEDFDDTEACTEELREYYDPDSTYYDDGSYFAILMDKYGEETMKKAIGALQLWRKK